MPAFVFAGVLRSPAMKRLLIVYHTQFGGTGQMAERRSTARATIDDVETTLMRAADAGRRLTSPAPTRC